MRTLLFCVFFISSQISFGQENLGSIKGYVTDKKGIPVDFITVLLKDSLQQTVKETYTDDDGYFVLKDVFDGTYSIFISEFGYHNTTIENIKVIKDFTQVINIQLSKDEEIIMGGCPIRPKLIDQNGRFNGTIKREDIH